MSSETIEPFISRAICPEVKIKFPNSIACEYGPIGSGAFGE
jgi:hypothetical protein